MRLARALLSTSGRDDGVRPRVHALPQRATTPETADSSHLDCPWHTARPVSSCDWPGRDLKSLSVDGGPITEIAGAGSRGYSCAGASWSPDGTIVHRPSGSRVLFSVPAVGGTPRQLTTIREAAVESFHIWPQVIDGGRRLLYTVLGPTQVWGDARIVIEDLETGERTTVVEQGTYGRYVPTGHIVYATAAGTLFAAPYDLAHGESTGDRFPVESGVRVAGWGGGASFAVSDAGTAAFVHGSTQARQLLWWVDREGRRVRQNRVAAVELLS